MTTSYNWNTIPETGEAFLVIPEGTYVIKKHGPRLYRAFFNDSPAQFAGHTVESVREMVDRSLREGSLHKVHGANGFSI